MAELTSVELILCLGLYAQRWHMATLARRTLNETVANWRESVKLSPAVIPLPHPSWRNNAWLKRNPWFESDLLPAVRAEVRRLIGRR
jgi:uracil-DNA glycosylase